MKKILSLLLALALCGGLGAPALAAVYEDPTAAAIDAIHRTLEAAGISDVPLSSPFAPAVAWAVENNITKGTTPTTFGPGNTCTTSHILTFLWRAAGRPGDAGEERAAVSAWAAGLGINVSDLGAPCTRAAAVTDIWKAQGSPAAKEAASFTDVAPSAPYAGAVSWAVEAGVTNGTGNGAFSPEAVCTRGQIVTFLYRAMAGSGAAEVPKEVEKPAQGGSGTLSNGKAITEENVYELLMELKAKYPEGSLYAPVGTSVSTIIYQPLGYVAGTGCAGWAAMASDYIFGKTGYVTTHKNFNNMRPGDVLTSDAHTSVIMYRKTCNVCGNMGYITSDSGSDCVVYWDKWGHMICPHCSASNLNKFHTVITRYPTDVPQYNPKVETPDSGSNTETSANPGSTDSGSGNSSSGNTSIPSGIHVDTDSPCGVCGKVSDNYVYSDDFARHVCLDCWKDPSGVGKWFLE